MVTVEEAREYLGADSGTDSDARLEAFIAAAVAAMETYAGRHFMGADVSETVKPERGCSKYLLLSEPARAIVSSDPDLPDEYRIEGSRLIAEGGNVFVERDGYELVYSAGYVAGEEPADLIQACRDQVAYLHSRWKADSAGLAEIESQTIDGWTQKFRERGGLAPHVAAIVDKYRPARL